MHDPQVLSYVYTIVQLIRVLSDVVREQMSNTTSMRLASSRVLAELATKVDDLIAIPIPPPCERLYRDCQHLFRTSSNLVQVIWDTSERYNDARAEHQEAITAIQYEILRLKALYATAEPGNTPLIDLGGE